MATDVRLDGRVLEDTVARLVEGAVFEHEVVGIAQQLFARQVTVHQAYIPRVPAEVFAIEVGIINCDILALPEGVLGENLSMVHLDILAVLEDILRIAVQSVDKDVLAEHKRIGTPMQGNILQTQVLDFPEGLVSIGDVDILEFYVVHLAEELRTIDATATHHQVVGIPDSRARAHRKVAVLDESSIDMPPGVLAIEATISGLHVLALFDATLAIGDDDILQAEVMGGKKRAFSPEFFVFDEFHRLF